MRHGTTDWNDMKRAQGQADVELNAEGVKRAVEAATRLADHDIDAIYSSDLKRALETARVIAEGRGLSIGQDAAFREIDQGEWTGLTTEEIRRRWPELWGRARHYTARPGGESPDDVQRRAVEGLKRVVERHPNGTVVVVSHGGTIRWIVAKALGYDTRQSARLRGLANGAVVAIEAESKDGTLELRYLHRMDEKPPDADDPNL